MGPNSVGVKSQPDLPDEGVILITLALKPVAVDAGAAAILRHHNRQRGTPDSSISVPEEILAIIRSRKHGDRSSYVRVSVPIGSHRYICRTYLMESQNGTAPQPMLMLHLQRDTAAPDAVYQIAAEYDLTDREKEALLGLALGLTSREVAKRMNISPNTVKTYVRLIMIKMGVTRRAAIVGKLLEYNGRLDGVHSS